MVAQYNAASPYGEHEKEIMAVEAREGKVLWRKKSVVIATTLAADSEKVYYHNGNRIVCLDRKGGTQKWTSPPVARIKPVPANFTPTLVVYKDVVLFAGGVGDNEEKPDLSPGWSAPTCPPKCR
jgi:outer membrane protein assembly factor BamB